MSNLIGSLTDVEILIELGSRLRAYRLQQNQTVVDVADRAGLNRNTVVNAEAGRNPRLETVVRLLRAYGRLETLNAFLPPAGVSPLELVETGGIIKRTGTLATTPIGGL